MKDILRKDHEERIEKRKENDNRKINKRSIFKTDLRTIACIVIITLIFPIINEESIVSNITLKIEGPGINDIFGSNFMNYPDKVIINGVENTTGNNSYYFNQTVNIVKLIWNNNRINDCHRMFDDCFHIAKNNFVLSSFLSNIEYLQGFEPRCMDGSPLKQGAYRSRFSNNNLKQLAR